MPHKQITQLPDNVENNLPKEGWEIYKEAFNSAEEQYREEDRAHRVAWSAVKQEFEKDENDNWVKKSRPLMAGVRERLHETISVCLSAPMGTSASHLHRPPCRGAHMIRKYI